MPSGSTDAKRRELRFESLGAALRDAEALAAADEVGRISTTGNWTLGQSLGHLAFWADAPHDGYPPLPRAPWLLRKLARLARRRILAQGFKPGVRFRGVAEGTYGVDRYSTAEGLARLRRAYQRLDEHPPTVANPIFGELTHDEWKSLNERHAELHLSFFQIG